jgi:hypothetical protein
MRVTTVGQKLIRNNRGKQLGRKGLAVVGAAGTGKSTCITQLRKKHQIDQQRRAPGLQGRIPVAYIVAPHEATSVKLSLELAAFLGLPVNRWDGEPYITRAVVSVLRKVSCGLILIDEIQRVELGSSAGAKAADYLKYLFDSVPAPVTKRTRVPVPLGTSEPGCTTPGAVRRERSPRSPGATLRGRCRG